MSEAVDEKIAGGLKVVALMREHGADVTQERLVSHLFLGDAEKLADLARYLFLEGFRVVLSGPDACLAEALSATDEVWVRQVTADMMRAADHNGVTYDGWEAEMEQPSLH